MAESDRDRWDRRYADREGPAHFRPSRLLLEHRHLLTDTGQDAPHQPTRLPAGRRALDVACGFGGNALYLASLDYQVDAVDVSAVALGQAQAEARRRGLPVNLIQADLTRWWLPPSHYDLITVTYYLDRALMPQLSKSLRAGGLLFVETWNARYVSARPGFNPAYLLQPGELHRFTLDAGLEVILVADGMRDPHTSQLIARRPG